MSEEVYQALLGNKLESVHLERLPVPDMSVIDRELEEDMALAGEVIASILAARDKAQIGVRWPLGEVIIDTDDTRTLGAIKRLETLILAQVNVKGLKTESFHVEYDVSANFQSLGKTFGQETGEVATLIKHNTQELITGLTGPQKEVVLGSHTLLPEHVNLEKKVPKGYSLGEFKRGTSYLNTSIDAELELEGFAREVTRRFQQMRKDTGLQKTDSIRAGIIGLGLEGFADEISKTIGASELLFETLNECDATVTATVRGIEFTLMLKK